MGGFDEFGIQVAIPRFDAGIVVRPGKCVIEMCENGKVDRFSGIVLFVPCSVIADDYRLISALIGMNGGK